MLQHGTLSCALAGALKQGEDDDLTAKLILKSRAHTGRAHITAAWAQATRTGGQHVPAAHAGAEGRRQAARRRGDRGRVVQAAAAGARRGERGARRLAYECVWLTTNEEWVESTSSPSVPFASEI